MQLKLGPITKTPERFKDDPISYLTADILLNGEKIGSVHTNGYAPRWAFEINKFRWRSDVFKYNTSDPRSPFYGLLHDGAAFDSAEVARAKAEEQLTRFETLRSDSNA